MRVTKLTYVLLLVGATVVAGTINYTLAAPLGDIIANPANTEGFKGTQYAIFFTTPTAGTVKSIEIEFPTDTTVIVGKVTDLVITDPSTGQRISGTNVGTTTADESGAKPILTYTFDTEINTPADAKWFAFVAKVRNPDVSSAIATSLSVTTKDSSGNIIDGPTSANFGIQPKITADDILSTINSKSGDICIGSGCP